MSEQHEISLLEGERQDIIDVVNQIQQQPKDTDFAKSFNVADGTQVICVQDWEPDENYKIRLTTEKPNLGRATISFGYDTEEDMKNAWAMINQKFIQGFYNGL